MPAYTVVFEMVDAYERPTRKEFETVATIADEAAALAAAAALATDLGNITEARILAYTVARRVVYVDTVDAGANRDEGAIMTLRKEDNKKASIRVPAPINAIFNADGTLDLTNAIVTAFATNFLTGGDWTFSDGEQAGELVSGYLES